MSADRHQRATTAFLELCDLDPEDQTRGLARLCEGDPALRAQVEAMLAADADAERFVEMTRHQEGFQRQLLALADPGSAPEQVGPYEIEGVLGEGGMGVVYRARREKPRRSVALKVVRPGLTSDAVLRHFEREVELLARLEHPAIARIYEAGMADGAWGPQPYFAMELVEGATLLRHVRRHELSVAERVELFRKVCEAVQHAHEHRVVHRDLKPANILVDADGTPRVLDFGIAVAADHEQHTQQLGQGPGGVLGSVSYMSPEQAAGTQEPNVRTDVYSLGVVLYELLSGELPYDVREVSVAEALRIVRDEEARPLRQVAPQLDRDLEAIVAKAIEKDRERRYPSVSALAADLVAWREHRPTLARPMAPFDHLVKFVRRHRAAVSVAALILLMLVTGLGTIWNLLSSEKAAHAQAAASRDEAAASRDEAVATVDQLSRVATLLDVLTRHKDSLDDAWPRRADAVRPLQEWIDQSLVVLGDRPDAEEELRGLVDRLGGKEDTKEEFLRQAYRQALDELGRVEGDLPRVRRNLEVARSIEEATLVEREEDWRRAIESIADLEDCPIYRGMVIEPQLGLVPLGVDEDSGLWEFLAWETGEEPEWDGQSWVITEETGVVLVLIPAMEVPIGGVRPTVYEASRPAGGTLQPLSEFVADPYAANDENPTEPVSLDAFFLAKYETTQGQWHRLASQVLPRGRDDAEDSLDPSSYPSGWSVAHFLPPRRLEELSEQERATVDRRHPVESVSQRDALAMARRFGLVLPTEAQWEAAARAGRPWVWTCGDFYGELRDHANLMDQTALQIGWQMRVTDLSFAANLIQWRDGYSAHAPVGSFAPNAFGLHDMLGNVAEWCLDEYRDYPRPEQRDVVDDHRSIRRPGDGALLPARPRTPEQDRAVHRRNVRGGSYFDTPVHARVRSRRVLEEDTVHSDVGLRFARPLHRSE